MFKILKKRFTTELILVALDINKKMRMEMNMSDYRSIVYRVYRQKIEASGLSFKIVKWNRTKLWNLQ